MASSNSNGKEALLVKECVNDKVVFLFVRKILKFMIELTDEEDVEAGLKKLQDMFKPAGGILDKTLDRVVPAEYNLDGLNSGMQGTADSDIENLRIAASFACHRWCRANDMGQE